MYYILGRLRINHGRHIHKSCESRDRSGRLIRGVVLLIMVIALVALVGITVSVI